MVDEAVSEDVRYVGPDTALLYERKTGSKVRVELLWGDRVVVDADDDGTGARAKVRARGKTGWVRRADLEGESLLEVYFIDVGQGDGVLIRTPDHRHILIDGGWPRSSQPIGKNAADFVDWKFKRDYGEDAIHLDAMICSHNDQDHYGGLWDLLDPEQHEELDVDAVHVEQFFHAGLSWWKKDQGSGRTLGPSVSTQAGEMFTRLLGDRASVEAALAPGASPSLQGEWAKFLRRVSEARTSGGAPTPISRLSSTDGYVPGFEPTAGSASVHVFAPVEFSVGGGPAIRKFSGGDSKNTNGNSVLLRLDHGNVRILLTGDLNTKSQNSLLDDYAGQESEFECDVAKACHHGSHDVSYRFLEEVNAAVTVMSSGDSEGHDHPRPNIIAASATSGYRTVAGDQLRTPLIYSTELARSVGFGHPTLVEIADDDEEATVLQTFGPEALKNVWVTYETVQAGDRNPSTRYRTMDRTELAANLIFGLVNVRTDGRRILCAALNETKGTWNVEVLEPPHYGPRAWWQ